jgi:hypothetical protein
MTKEEALTKALNQLKRADQIIQSLCPQGYIHPALCSIHGAIVNVQEALAQPEQEPVARAWDEGYRFGVNDERMSEANIGIAGMGMKVEPARNNPYRTTPPQRTEENT